jgi:hypothetical protein
MCKQPFIFAVALLSSLCTASWSFKTNAQPGAALTKPDFERLWTDLGDADCAKSFGAVAKLAQTPKETTEFIATTLVPIVAADPAQVESLVKDLDDAKFGVREKAMRELEKLGESAVPALRAALKANAPLEVRLRIEHLLKRFHGPITQGDPLRVLRAVEVLQRLGTAEAKLLLRRYASGAAGSRLADEAQDALARLDWIEPQWKITRPVISPKNAAQLARIDDIARDVWEMHWWPRTRELVMFGWEQPVEILDPQTFKVLRTIAPDRRLIHFAVSKDANMTAMCENTTQVIVQNLRSGRSLVLECQSPQPSMAFSSDGRLLATGGYGTAAKVWDTASGLLVRTLEAAGQAGGLTVDFSPDEKILVVGNRNAETRLFDAATGKMLHELPRKMSQGLQFSPDSSVLAVAYVDGNIGLWDVASGQLIAERATGAQEVYRVQWSPRGDVLASSGLKGKITLWDPKQLSILKELESPEWVIGLRFSPDGTRLFTAGGGSVQGANRKVTVWGVPEGPAPSVQGNSDGSTH